MSRGRTLVVILIALGAWASGAVPAGAAPPPPSACPPGQTAPAYPPGSCRLAVEPTTVAPGGSVTVSGCGFGPGTRVSVVLVPQSGTKSVMLGRVLADSTGCINASLTVPARTEDGTYVITATGKDASRRAYQLVSDPITVATSSAAIEADLAAAHSDAAAESTAPLALTAAGVLVAMGSGVVCRARRRRVGSPQT